MEATTSFVFLNYLTTVFDDIGDGILLVGIEPGPVYRLAVTNRALIDLSGYPADSVGKPISELVSPEIFAVLDHYYQRVIQTRQPVTFTHRFTLPAGKRIVQTKLIPILNAVGQCTHIAAIVHDKTENVRLRELLAAQSRALRQPPAAAKA